MTTLMDPAPLPRVFHPAIAALRVWLRSILQRASANHRILREASRLLARWCLLKYQLNQTNHFAFQKLIRGILEPVPAPRQTNGFNQTNRLALETLVRASGRITLVTPVPPQKQMVLTKRIECIFTNCSRSVRPFTHKKGGSG